MSELGALLTEAASAFPQMREHLRLVEKELGGRGVRRKVGARGGGLGGAPPPTVVTTTAALQRDGGRGDLTDALHAVFTAADTDGNGSLDRAEFASLLRGMDRHLRSLPATAQVARQQGKYLAGVFNNGGLKPGAPRPPPFKWTDMGSLAFIGGNEAVARLPGVGVLTGLLTGLLWRGFETASQQSVRSRMAVTSDQVRSKLWGRGL